MSKKVLKKRQQQQKKTDKQTKTGKLGPPETLKMGDSNILNLVIIAWPAL